MRRLTSFVLAVCAALIVSCVNLEPRETNIQYYVLGGESGLATPNPESDRAGLSVGLRRLRLADYLDTPDIVTRFGRHEVQFSEFHRWGEDLDTAINRTLGERLAARPGLQTVEVAPWSPASEHDYVVQVSVLRFEGTAPRRRRDDDERLTGEAHLVASWDVVDPSTGDVAARGTTDHRVNEWRVGHHPELVSRLDAAVDALADDLAARLLDLATERESTAGDGPQH